MAVCAARPFAGRAVPACAGPPRRARLSGVREVPLLASRSPTLQVVSAIVLPIVFGLICGIVLGVNGALYGVLSVLAILGGIGAGYEHPDAVEGAARGIAGGMLFGTFILFGHAVAGTHAKAALPDPH